MPSIGVSPTWSNAHVNVGFFRGAEIADPDGLLEGTGKFMRHVKLTPKRDVDARALMKLIDSERNLATQSNASLSDDFVQSINDAGEFFLRCASEARPNAIDGQSSDLTNLDPRLSTQACRLTFESQRESRARFLSRQGHGDDRA